MKPTQRNRSQVKDTSEAPKRPKAKKMPASEVNTNPALHPLGSERNPLVGPAPHDFRGPEVNYTPSSEAIANGRAAPLGTQANPLVGPPIGVSPGVQNPGAISSEGSTSSFVQVTEEDEQQQIQATDGKLNDPNASPRPPEAPATLITTSEGGEVKKQTITPEPGKSALETAQQAAGVANGTQARQEEADTAAEKKKADEAAAKKEDDKKKADAKKAADAAKK